MQWKYLSPLSSNTQTLCTAYKLRKGYKRLSLAVTYIGAELGDKEGLGTSFAGLDGVSLSAFLYPPGEDCEDLRALLWGC